jgi:hypothetical protein
MHPKSHLFYQTRSRRPVLSKAKGVYLWDVDGKRYLDGSSGAMVSNIGHSDPLRDCGDARPDGQVDIRLAVYDNCSMAHSTPVEQEPSTSSALGHSVN